MKMVYERSSKNLADPLTKPFARDLVQQTHEEIGWNPQISKH